MLQVIKRVGIIGLLGMFAIGFVLLFIYILPKTDDSEDANLNHIGSKGVNLKALVIGTPPKEGLDELYEELDKLTLSELGCTLRFEFIPWGDERRQLNIATASGEYDFIPGGVFSDYLTLVSKKAFLDLKEYLYLVPELVDHYKSEDSSLFKKCEIQGGLYGLPEFSSNRIANIGAGFFYREDLRKQWNLEPITDLQTMEAYLYRAKEEYKGEPIISDNRIWMALWDLITEGKYIEISSAMDTPFVVVEADNPGVPISRINTPEFKVVLSYIKKWFDDGIIASDILMLSDNEGSNGLNLILEDKRPCETNTHIWVYTDTYIPQLYSAHPDWEFGYFDYTLSTAKLYLDTLTKNSVISISSKTSSPEIAIKLLEKLHTDERYYRLMMYGVEGINYSINRGAISYNNISVDNIFSGMTAGTDEQLEHKKEPVNKKWQTNVMDEYNAEVERRIQTAQYNKLIDFKFNTTSVVSIIEKFDKVKKEVFQPLVCGVIDNQEETIDVLNEKLTEAGFEKYLNEIQNQLQR